MNDQSKGTIGGVFTIKHVRDGEVLSVERSKNIVVDQGILHLLNVLARGAGAEPQVSPWYIGLFEGNYTPLATNTAANFPGFATECTAYAEATRVDWAEDAAAANSIANGTTEAVFTMNAAKTVYGGFLVSTSGKNTTSGILLCASRFATPKAVEAADSLVIEYALNMASA